MLGNIKKTVIINRRKEYALIKDTVKYNCRPHGQQIYKLPEP